MKVVVSPNYILLCKSDMHQDNNLFNQKENPDSLALGGVYEVLGEDSDCLILQPEKGSKRTFFLTPKYYLRTYENVKYDFKVNDLVTFEPICSEEEKRFLLSLKFFKNKKQYKIHRVINHYYVELINENGDISIPIRFCDIKPSS